MTADDSLRADGHTCVCVIKRGEKLDSCKGWVDNPDQPFCDDCTNASHELLADPTEVAARIAQMTGAQP